MASMLQTTIHNPLPYIHIWSENSYFQLLTSKHQQHQIMPLFLNPPPSNLPILNETPKGRIITIPALRTLHAVSQLADASILSSAIRRTPSSFPLYTAFCHPYCPTITKQPTITTQHIVLSQLKSRIFNTSLPRG